MNIKNRRDAERKDYVNLIENAGGIFFTGGDQNRITDALLRTPVGDAIFNAYWRSDKIIAGINSFKKRFI